MPPTLKKILASQIRSKKNELRDWYMSKIELASPPFYFSVDIRDAGFKVVAVDGNLYPAGFNNICPTDQLNAPTVFKNQFLIEAKHAQIREPKKILILPESHTSNTYYIENLWTLSELVKNGGFDVEIGWYDAGDEIQNPVELTSHSGQKLLAHPIRVKNKSLSAGGFTPDIVLLNNDFSSGYPKILDQVSQPIVPSHTLGWHSRCKSKHFEYYNKLALEFAQVIDIDPWLIQLETELVSDVDFAEEKGLDRIAQTTELMIERLKEAYKKHNLKQDPFVYIKSNTGTYGMGVMVAHSGQEVLEVNRRTKNKMSVGKGKQHITSVIVQEGVPTITKFKNATAESAIYLVGCELIGGFLRTHPERSQEENLNSPGMVLEKLCMSDLQKLSDEDLDHELNKDEPTVELVYGSIARLSAFAAGMELKG